MDYHGTTALHLACQRGHGRAAVSGKYFSPPFLIAVFLRWLKTVSNTYFWMGHYNHSLSLDAM